jgi:hypothetical protein
MNPDFSCDSAERTHHSRQSNEETAMRVPRNNRSRSVLIAVMIVFAMALSPAVFARDHGRGHGHIGVRIGFAGPGYSVGYSDYGRGRHGWGGSLYSGYGYGGYGGYYAPAYYPVVNRGYYYDSPAYYPTYGSYYRYDRPVVRRVVHREVRYYDDHDRRDDHRRDGYRYDSYRNDRDYRRRDDSYGKASYYDRGH